MKLAMIFIMIFAFIGSYTVVILIAFYFSTLYTNVKKILERVENIECMLCEKERENNNVETT